jgi:hypothetical protein
MEAEQYVNSLVGLFCQSKTVEGWIHWQGRIAGEISTNIYLVQLFSAVDGSLTQMVLVPLEKMIEEEWDFYSEQEDWIAAYDRKVGRHED